MTSAATLAGLLVLLVCFNFCTANNATIGSTRISLEQSCFRYLYRNNDVLLKSRIRVRPEPGNKIYLETSRFDNIGSKLVCVYNNRTVILASVFVKRKTVDCTYLREFFKLDRAFIDASCGSDCWTTKKTTQAQHAENCQMSANRSPNETLYRCELTFRDRTVNNPNSVNRFRRIGLGFVIAVGIVVIYGIGVWIWKRLHGYLSE